MRRHEKPLMFGYYSARESLPAEHLRGVRSRLQDFAEAEGFCLAGLFGETAEQPATELQAMLDSAGRRDVAAIAVPSLDDLGATCDVQQLARQRLADAGVRLLVLVGGA